MIPSNLKSSESKMNSYKILIKTSLLLVILTGCSSVTIQPEPIAELTENPSFEDSKPFYFWGLKGEHHVDVKKVCGEKDVLQMQSQQTFEDGALGFITLGIYAPHSVKIWCDEKELNKIEIQENQDAK